MKRFRINFGQKVIALAVCICFGSMVLAPAALAVEPALPPADAAPAMLEPVASGTVVLSNTKAAIDASNAGDGYIMVRYKEPTEKKLKLRITGPNKTVYTYNLNGEGRYETFFSDYVWDFCSNSGAVYYLVPYYREPRFHIENTRSGSISDSRADCRAYSDADTGSYTGTDTQAHTGAYTGADS